MKFSGVADLRLGAAPLLHGVLTARQLDADRLLARANATPDSPLELLKGIGGSIAAVPSPPLPVQLEISSDLTMLGGRPIQNAAADLRSNGRDWLIDHLEFRAPGATAVTLNGRITGLNGSPDFNALANVDVGDPDALMSWLRGQSDAPYLAQKPMQLKGSVSINKDRISVDSLKAEIDGHAIGGSIALTTSDGVSKLNAALTADAIDWTSLSPFAPRLSEAPRVLPQEMRVALDIGSVTAFGQTLRPVKLQLDYGPKSVAVERLRIGSADGVMVEGNGAFDRASAAGQLNLSTSSPSLDQVGKLVAPLYPKLAQRIAALPTGAGNVWVGLSLGLDRPSGDRANVRANLDLDSPAIKGSIAASMAPTIASLGALDPQAIKDNAFNLTGKLSADHGSALLTALGLDRALAVGKGAATLDVAASGAWQKPVTVKASLSGRELDATVEGTVEPWNTEPAAALGVTVRKANIAPLAGSAPDASIIVAATSRLDLAGNAINLTGFDATFGASRLRGRLGLKLGDELAIDGELGADTIDIPAIVVVATGAAGKGSTEPFGKGLLRGWRGRVAFQTLRAIVPGGDIRPLSGTVAADGTAVTLESITGNYGGGQAKADLAARRDDEGVALTGHIQLTGADGARLRYRGLAMPSGRVVTDLTFAASGRSAAALINGMSGSGSLTIDNARISGFEPNVFQIVADASDAGQALDLVKFKSMVEALLSGGTIAVTSADFPIAMKDGQLRVASTVLNGNGARLTVGGNYDIAADKVEMRATLSPAVAASSLGGSRPEIQVMLSGSPDALVRMTDVSALSAWLTLRSIDRETKRLEAIERNTQANRVPQPAAPDPPAQVSPVNPSPPISPPASLPPEAATVQPAPSTNTAVPPLPPAIEVRPTPGAPARLPTAKPRQPLALTPGGTQ